MDFTYQTMQVRTLFGGINKQLVIPRYQREYTWEKEEVSEFFDDILSGIHLDGINLGYSEYFFGTILLAGNLGGSDKIMEVIDGQQRITTMTIFFSVMTKLFKNIGNDDLASGMWNYVMKKDDDRNEFKILDNETADAFFNYLVQSEEPYKRKLVDNEQKCILEAYNYFYNSLQEKQLKKRLKQITSNVFDKIEYENILKSLRDRLLDSMVICISTVDKKKANLIFEILNAKGKKLGSIDLIKNELFKHLDKTEPTDIAHNNWMKIKENLRSREVNCDFESFYKCFWWSKYKKSTEQSLYADFKKIIKPKDYKAFLEELENASIQYVKIICSYTKDYSNKKELLFITECFDNFKDVLNVTQVRVFLLALISQYENGKINTRDMRRVLIYSQNFHFSYNGLCALPSNKLETIYSKGAQALRNTKNKGESKNVIDTIINQLDEIYPKYPLFRQKFVELKYSAKRILDTNMLCKFILNQMEMHELQIDVKPSDGSVEHIYSESAGDDFALNIGNLILLEKRINESIGNIEFSEKLKRYDADTNYKCVKKFCNDNMTNNEWGKVEIEERANQLAYYYYTEILGKELTKTEILGRRFIKTGISEKVFMKTEILEKEFMKAEILENKFIKTKRLGKELAKKDNASELNEDINTGIVQLNDTSNKYLVVNIARTLSERNLSDMSTILWWHKDNKTYTDNIHNARIFTYEEVIKELNIDKDKRHSRKFAAIPVDVVAEFNQANLFVNEKVFERLRLESNRIIGNKELYLDSKEIHYLI